MDATCSDVRELLAPTLMWSMAGRCLSALIGSYLGGWAGENFGVGGGEHDRCGVMVLGRLYHASVRFDVGRVSHIGNARLKSCSGVSAYVVRCSAAVCVDIIIDMSLAYGLTTSTGANTPYRHIPYDGTYRRWLGGVHRWWARRRAVVLSAR